MGCRPWFYFDRDVGYEWSDPPTGPPLRHGMVTRRGWRPFPGDRKADRDAYALFRADWRRLGITSGEYARRFRLDAARLWDDDVAHEHESPLHGDGDRGYVVTRLDADGTDIGRRPGKRSTRYVEPSGDDDSSDESLHFTSVRMADDYGSTRLEWDPTDTTSRRLHDVHLLVSVRDLGLTEMVRRTGLKADTLRKRYKAARARVLSPLDADVFPDLPRGRPRKSGIATMTYEEGAGNGNPPAPARLTPDEAA